jgi:rhodanese-related sulfurtransferase
MGWIAPYDRDLVLIVDDRASYEEARLVLQRIGLDRIVGYMIGLDGWIAAGRNVDTLGEVTAVQLNDTLGKPDQPEVLDVRSATEFQEDHIPGATHHFLGDITQGNMADLDHDQEIVVVCSSGYRSTVAAALMQDVGFTKLSNLEGGMQAWNDIGSKVRP